MRLVSKGNYFPTSANRPPPAWITKMNTVKIRSFSVNPALAHCLNIMLTGVEQQIKREDLNVPTSDTDSREEQLRRRCVACARLSAGGFAFSFLYLRFDPSADNPVVLGIYALVLGGVGCVTYKTRHYLYRSARKRELRKQRKANTELIFLGGGIG